MKKKIISSSAFAFILLMGIISLFSDITHEGAAGIMGSYLGLAGASAATIGFVSGLGECVGYSLRLVTGIITDKSKKYWTLTIIGYVIDCLAIPALALIPKGGWIYACMLIIIQRIGKAIKKPAKDTLLSFAAAQNNTGKSFAIQELLDQIGAFLGPVLLFFVILLKKSDDLYSVYSVCFLILGIPAIITILLLFFAKKKFPNPEQFEPTSSKSTTFKINKSFIFYIIAISLFACGFIDFTIITLHSSNLNLVPESTLSLIYALAMVIDAFSALFFGWLFDKIGIKSLVYSTLLAMPFAFLIFYLNNTASLLIGVCLWGVGMGAQESILKAAVTKIVPKENRSKGFGIFQTFFGVFWFLGSWLIGILYDKSIIWMIIFSSVMQLLSIPLFYICASKNKQIKINEVK